MNNNNSALYDAIKSAEITSALVVHSSGPGFAIPIARFGRLYNSLYTPTVNRKRKINGFSQIAEVGRMQILRTPRKLALGQNEVFSLIGLDGQAIAGTRTELSPIIAGWLNTITASALKLNLAIFCRNYDVAYQEGRLLFQRKSKELGNEDAAARWFISAFICLPIARELARALIDSDPFEDGMDLSALPQIIINVHNDIDIYFSDEVFKPEQVGSKQYRVDVRNILELARLSTNRNVAIKYGRHNNIDDEYDRLALEAQISDELARLLSLKNQEGRVAYLLEMYINKPDIYSYVIDHYEDKSGFANRAIALLRNKKPSMIRNHSDGAFQVASIIAEIMRFVFPPGKERLIVALSIRLGSYNVIRHQLNGFIRRSSVLRALKSVEEIKKVLQTK
ncbi:hypothetical protein FPV16_20480 [Methylobacterium sp. W2]|uniref:hypothetical protein n=1 Tax=Methylobacterium sp. W2 TaxID=2598107 RepID=UPI001D0C95CE|nr:hypothetical protein [Methylobacterium sp. W2]MCC0808553.1 hypothetical protein [Methylobacterium sp. W2]